MNDIAARQRAQLFADVDQLKQDVKIQKVNNMDTIKELIEVNNHLIEHATDIKNILEGSLNLIESDNELSKRMDIISDRIDIVNKRLRKLEEAVKP